MQPKIANIISTGVLSMCLNVNCHDDKINYQCVFTECCRVAHEKLHWSPNPERFAISYEIAIYVEIGLGPKSCTSRSCLVCINMKAYILVNTSLLHVVQIIEPFQRTSLVASEQLMALCLSGAAHQDHTARSAWMTSQIELAQHTDE